MEKKQRKEYGKGEKRTSLKNIIGGDILATDFFRRQAGLLFLIMVLYHYLHQQPLRMPTATDRDRQS